MKKFSHSVDSDVFGTTIFKKAASSANLRNIDKFLPKFNLLNHQYRLHIKNEEGLTSWPILICFFKYFYVFVKFSRGNKRF